MPLSTVALLIPAALLLLICHVWVNVRQPEPYMDELFHVPQAEGFCAAVRARRMPLYDPSITTLPGLYVPPALFCLLLPNVDVASPRMLRYSSFFFSLLSIPLMTSVQCRLRARSGLHPHAEPLQSLTTFALWLHPVALFYAHLFYTDAPATAYLLLCWCLALSGRHFGSAMAGLFAAFTRQTHMVWHFYVAADSMLQSFTEVPCTLAQLFLTAQRSILQLWPHAAAGAVYVGFLLVNGGPAVGDRAHHAISFHYAMLPYFLGFHALAYAPFQLLSPKGLFRQVKMVFLERKCFLAFAGACCALAALVFASGDRVHPFILADNRHYTFYLYRKWLLRSSLRRLCLVPLYTWGALGPWLEQRACSEDTLKSKHKKNSDHDVTGFRSLTEHIGSLLLFCCAAVTLVSSPLMEPRYFVIGSLFLSMKRLSHRRTMMSARNLLLICCLLTCINLVLVYIFAERPFLRPVDLHMPRDRSPGRFMF